MATLRWRRGVGTVTLAAMLAAGACGSSFAQSSPVPSAPRATEGWPQPDHFAEALRLTSRKPREAAAAVRPRWGAGRAAPNHYVVPVQTQAYGFAAPFRAVVAAELDVQLDRLGLEAGTQVDVADAAGPFVRTFDESALARLHAEFPASKQVELYLGHDGADTLHLSLVVRAAGSRKVAHRSMPLAADADAVARDVAAALPGLLASTGLVGQARPSAAAESCGASAWRLDEPAAMRTTLHKACQAIAMASLLPEYRFDGAAFSSPPTEARLAWLARAQVQAAAVQPATAVSRAIHRLARLQLQRSTLMQAPPLSKDELAGFLATQDPVVQGVARLLAMPLVKQAPVSSARESMDRQADTIAEGMPELAAAAVRAQARWADPFREIDFCAFEHGFPGAMVGAACRLPNGVSPPAASRRATSAEFVLFQEWRLAASYRAVHRQAASLGLPERAIELARALPADLATHPFIQRAVISAASRGGQLGGMDALVAAARIRADSTVDNMVNLQRLDGWVSGMSLSEHEISTQIAVQNDSKVMAAIDDEARLLAVLKFDRFGASAMSPWRARAGFTPFFLQAGRGQMLQALASETRAQGMPSQEMLSHVPAMPTLPMGRVPTSGVAAGAVALFVVGERRTEVPSPQALEQALQRWPDNMGVRVELAQARLKRGGSMADAKQLIQAAPENRRDDDRIMESHNWATPAHFMFFAAEPEASLDYYEKVVRIGTGSESDLYARGRIALLQGRMDAALDATRRRMQRYDSDFVRRDLAGMLFMNRQSDAAWQALLPRAAAGRSLQLWDGAMVGHRMEGVGPAEAVAWLRKNGLHDVRVKNESLRWYYTHLLTVMDRLPTPADESFLSKGDAPYDAPPRFGVASARLTRVALAGSGEEATIRELSDMLKAEHPDRIRFLLPLYAWVDWKATKGQGALLSELRATGPDGDFDELLAKSMVLALDGDVEGSLRAMRAARYDLGGLALGTSLLNRTVPSPYQYALAGYLMHRQTGQEAYRQETLRFVRAYQKVFPYTGWLYGLEALLETQAAVRQVAACRARLLDANSYFLNQAGRAGASSKACPKALW